MPTSIPRVSIDRTGKKNYTPAALITGASSGLGETFARKLAARGYDLIMVARRAERLEKLACELPVHTQTVAADLATEDGIRAVEDAIRARSPLDLLVNNAGFGTLGRFWEAGIEGQDAMHRLHVLATVRLTHAALGPMVARGTGGVINVSSVAAFAMNPGNASYCATKAWMTTFSEGLGIELRDAGSAVTVQSLCPGFTYTEFHDTLGVDRGRIPKVLWLSADLVVEESLRGLERGAPIVVPGAIYKALVAALQCLPFAVRRRLRRPFRDKRV